jgi:predicted RND superfamily exporter protein
VGTDEGRLGSIGTREVYHPPPHAENDRSVAIDSLLWRLYPRPPTQAHSARKPSLSSPQNALRERIEDGLGRWARFVSRHALAVTLSMLVLAAGLTSQIPKIEVKASSEDFLFEGDPVRAAYDAYKVEFGQDQLALVMVEAPEIFDLGFLERLVELHRELEEELPFLEEITSLWNVRSVYGRGDELVVEDLLDEMPETEAELAELRQRVLSTPSYRKRGLISEDGRATAILIEVATYTAMNEEEDLLGGFDEGMEASGPETEKRAFFTGPENAAFVRALKAVIERHDAADFRIRSAGGTLFTYEITTVMAEDVPLFFGGGLLAIVVLLALLFRRFSPVFVCILVVIPTVVSSFGLAAILGIPFSVLSQMVPSFLLSIGVGYTVHLVTIYLRELGHGISRTEALESALRHSGLPIMMTALTTTTGMLAFLVAQMKPIVDMGLLAALGTAVSLVFSMTLLPALLVLLPISPKPERESPIVSAVLGGFANFSARHPWPIVAATVGLVLVALCSMTWLRVSSDPTIWLPEDHGYRMGSDYAIERFAGQMTYELLMDTGRPNGVKEPAFLNAVERIEEIIADHRSRGALVSHTNSIVEIVKETHQALNADDEDFYAIPQDPRLVAQELLLFENGGADDLEKVVDPEFQRTRLTLKTGWRDGIDLDRFLNEAEDDLAAALAGRADLGLTGMSVVIARTISATIESVLRSYGVALALITPLMIILIGSLRAGLVSMVPNLTPILMTLGLMGLLDIPLDMFTLLAGCIAIGLAVDDSIHFIAGFRRYLAQGNDPVRAVELTMQTTGRALLFTSIVLTMGFIVLTFSSLGNLVDVGILTSFAITSAFLLDVTVTPALLVLTHRPRDS